MSKIVFIEKPLLKLIIFQCENKDISLILGSDCFPPFDQKYELTNTFTFLSQDTILVEGVQKRGRRFDQEAFVLKRPGI